MTDPTGRSFLSYRRSRINDGRKIIEAQHDLGIPTWQDLKDLSEGHTDQQLREVLVQRDIANAVAYITPDVGDSPTITRTELPGIVRRVDAKDGFFMVPVAAGGLKFDDIAATVGTYLGTHDLSQWNITKLDSNPLSDDDAIIVAGRVLKHRLSTIHMNLPSGAPLIIGLHTRSSPPFIAGTALNIDWTHRFDGRQASATVWKDNLLPALATVHDGVARFAPARAIEFTGFCAIPAAIALGSTFLATTGISAAWQQNSAKREVQRWSLARQREPSGFDIDLRAATTAADDVAVLVSIASNVEAAFAASRPHLPQFRATLHIRRQETFPQDLATPGQAVDVASLVVEGLRQARDEYQARGTVHLFLAIPVGLAFLIGQSLNTVGPVQTYEHIPTDAVGQYQPAAFLQPVT
jgi:hypothetical protein